MSAAPQAKGLLISAPSSGGGKTLVTLGLLRALSRRADAGLGPQAVSAKVGPDYIDPAYHASASKAPCLNLDSWAMRPQTLDRLTAGLGRQATLILCEGVMGLFDGAFDQTDPNRDGSTASLARRFGWPVVMVLDARGQSQSAAAVARGFKDHAEKVDVAAIILNHVGGARHEEAIRRAFKETLPDLPVIGALPRVPTLGLPSRHLGLVQAHEHPDLEAFLDAAADAVAEHVDLDALTALARTGQLETASEPESPAHPLKPLGQRIAVAQDTAFAFAYPAILQGWRDQGAEVLMFSPLADEAPPSDCDSVYLPGGYPELHAPRLAASRTFKDGLRAMARKGLPIYGECGGYMTLGKVLIDKDGAAHKMADLLPLSTSFAQRRIHLGYRRVSLLESTALGQKGQQLRGHEFHYATLNALDPEGLFEAADAAGQALGPVGHRQGSVFGSFIHLIDQA